MVLWSGKYGSRVSDADCDQVVEVVLCTCKGSSMIHDSFYSPPLKEELRGVWSDVMLNHHVGCKVMVRGCSVLAIYLGLIYVRPPQGYKPAESKTVGVLHHPIIRCAILDDYFERRFACW